MSIKALFCYDGPIQKDNLGNHYSPVINNKVFDRYLGHADEITIALRVDTFSEEEARKSTLINEEKVHICEIPNLATLKGTLFDRINARQILVEEMKKTDFAIIRLPSFIGTVAVRVANKLRKPYLIEVVGCPWDSLWNYGIKGKMIAPFVFFSMKIQVKHAKYVVYVTNSFLQSRYPTTGKSTNCSNVEVDSVEDDVLHNRIEKITALSGVKIIGTAADVNVPYKGHQYIIEALGRLKKQGHTDFIYQMAGSGDQSRLKKCAEDNGVNDQVVFMGSLSRENLFDWLDSIDIYVQPSRQEGLPRALIEAMSRGLPCIGAKTGGIPELLPTECIFSNTSKNIDEICELLMSYSLDKMIVEAKNNHEASKVYLIEKIRTRRNSLLDELMRGVNNV